MLKKLKHNRNKTKIIKNKYKLKLIIISKMMTNNNSQNNDLYSKWSTIIYISELNHFKGSPNSSEIGLIIWFLHPCSIFSPDISLGRFDWLIIKVHSSSSSYWNISSTVENSFHSLNFQSIFIYSLGLCWINFPWILPSNIENSSPLNLEGDRVYWLTLKGFTKASYI